MTVNIVGTKEGYEVFSDRDPSTVYTFPAYDEAIRKALIMDRAERGAQATIDARKMRAAQPIRSFLRRLLNQIIGGES